MKDYKKILEGVVNIINTTERSDIGFTNICSYIGENCPELAESEGERIRKEMIEIIKNEALEFPSSVIANKSNSWIAWLEKQGEHANFRNKIQIGDKVTRNEDGVLVNLSQLNRVANKDEKKGEQKPAEWSEEDEKMHDFAIRAIGLCKQYAINHQVNGYSNLPDVPKRYEELQDWLKSLKGRYTWKPSDEQLDSLYDILNPCDGFNREVLESLYVQLKKLREE